MSLSKSVRHYRHCSTFSKLHLHSENSNGAPPMSKMTMRSLTQPQWKVLSQLKVFITRLVNESGVQLTLNKEFTNLLQKVKPSVYASDIVRDLESPLAQRENKETKPAPVTIPPVTKAEPVPIKDQGYRLPSVLTGFGFGGNTTEKDPAAPSPPVIPKWKINRPINVVSPLSIAARTNHVISQIATAENEASLLRRVEHLISHLQQFPEAKNYAVKQGAIRLLLGVRENTDSGPIQASIREAFARLGHVDPLPGRGIRILSIDGGGIRGLLVIEMLKRLEQLTGLRVYEMFDYVCGVSTGAILTGALVANRKTLENTSKYYKELSAQIFTQNALLGTSNLVLKQSYYDTELWEKLLREYLGDISFIKTSRDPQCPKLSAVSAVVNQSQLSAFVFRNYALPFRVHSQYMGSSDCSVWQAARASAAAPTYFEEFMLNGHLHQDGGIMVNNPTAIAIHEAKQLWPNSAIQCVVSFGTGRTLPIVHDLGDGTNQASSSSWKSKFLKIVDSATDTEGVHTMLNDLLPPGVYYRFNPYLTEYLSMVEIRPDKIAQLEQDAAMYLRRNEDKFEQAASALIEPRSTSQKVNDWVDRKSVILGIKRML